MSHLYQVRPNPLPVQAWKVDGTPEQAREIGFTLLQPPGFQVIGRTGWITGTIGDWIVLEDGQFPAVLTDKMFHHKYQPAEGGA